MALARYATSHNPGGLHTALPSHHHMLRLHLLRYYKDWIIDNDITFGAINSKHGVIEFVSQGDNPVGLAAPALAVRGGSMLITYSFSGPFNIPLSNGGIRAYPGKKQAMRKLTLLLLHACEPMCITWRCVAPNIQDSWALASL